MNKHVSLAESAWKDMFQEQAYGVCHTGKQSATLDFPLRLHLNVERGFSLAQEQPFKVSAKRIRGGDEWNAECCFHPFGSVIWDLRIGSSWHH